MPAAPAPPAPPIPAAPPSDERLLQAFALGDRAAFATLAARHEPAMLGLASALLDHRPDAAAEAVQEAWLRVIRHARTFRTESSAKTWLYRVLINTCHDARAKSRRPRTAPSTADPPARTADPDAHDDVRRAVADLPPDQRLVLALCYHHALTHPQAADVLGLPLGTLKSRLHAALTTLRARLAKEAAR